VNAWQKAIALTPRASMAAMRSARPGQEEIFNDEKGKEKGSNQTPSHTHPGDVV